MLINESTFNQYPNRDVTWWQLKSALEWFAIESICKLLEFNVFEVKTRLCYRIPGTEIGVRGEKKNIVGRLVRSSGNVESFVLRSRVFVQK